MRKVFALISIVVMLTSCGKQNLNTVEADSNVAVSYVDHSDFDWQKGNWNCDFTDGNGDILYFQELDIILENEYVGEPYSQYIINGPILYCLNTYTKAAKNGWERIYYFNTYDSRTKKSSSDIIEVPLIEGYSKEQCVISSYDIVEENEYVLFVQVWENDAVEDFYATHINKAGDVLKIDNLQQMLLETSITVDKETKAFYGEIYVDSQGLYYVYDNNQMLIWNSENDEKKLIDKSSEDSYCSFAFRTLDGLIITLWRGIGNESARMTYYDAKAGEIVLCEGNIPSNCSMTLAEEGYLFYLSNDAKVYRWDLISGIRNVCVDFASVGASNDAYSTQLLLSEQGFPLLLDYEGKQARLYSSGRTPIERKTKDIRIVDLQRNNISLGKIGFVADSAIRFTRENSDYQITVESTNNDDIMQLYDAQETFRTKAMADLVSGNIADIYLVDAEDLQMLNDKGILVDLSSVITDELREHIFSTSQLGGVIDGKQVALVPEANVSTVLVRDSVWKDKGWTLDEAIFAMERNNNFKYLINSPITDYGQNLLFRVYLKNLNNTPFLNLQAGTCNFENPLFGRLIERFKNYGSTTMWEDENQVYETSAGILVEVQGYQSFSLLMEQYGKDYNIVGYPTAEGVGSYWNPNVYLVVTNHAKDMDSISEFIQYLFSAKNQANTLSSVRNDLLDQFVEYVEDDYGIEGVDGWKYHIGDSYWPIGRKPDGSSWAEEYVSFMESCSYPDIVSEDIIQIIKSEVYDYYDGYSNSNAAVTNIQNRVQLYLDENR